MSATADSLLRSEWSPSTKASVTAPGMASVSRSNSAGSREGVAAARDEQARQTQVREVGGAESLGPSGRVQRVADENEGGDIEALGRSH